MIIFLFLFINLYFLIPAVITQTCNPVAELVITIGTSTREAKAEMKTHPIIVEISLNEGQFNWKFSNTFLFHLFVAI